VKVLSREPSVEEFAVVAAPPSPDPSATALLLLVGFDTFHDRFVGAPGPEPGVGPKGGGSDGA
jgi:hypothetical protein